MRTWLPVLVLGFALCARPSPVAASSFAFDVMAGGASGSADGTGSAAEFSSPSGMAADSQGNVYVADTGNDTIRKVTPDGIVTTVAGSAGQVGSANGTGSAARFASPYGIALDGSGNLYVADSGNDTIRRITPAGVTTTLAGTAGQAGDQDGSSALFHSPLGVAVDAAGNVYVADGGNLAIRKITPAGVTSTVAASSSLTSNFQFAAGIAVDAQGNLYVNCNGENEGQGLYEISSTGAVSFLGGSAGGLNHPGVWNGIALDGRGEVYATGGPANFPAGDLTSEWQSSLIAISGAAGLNTLLNFEIQFPDSTSPAPSAVFLGGPAIDAAGNLYFFANGLLIKGSVSPGGAIPPAPQTQSVNAGLAATLAAPNLEGVQAYGSAGLWEKNGITIGVGATFSLASAQPSDSGVYTYETSIGGVSLAYPVALGVNDAPGAAFLGTWTASAPLPNAVTYSSVAFDGANYLAAGADGSLFLSPNGSSWSRAGSAPGQINSLIFAGSTYGFLGVGNNGAIVADIGPAYAPASQASGTNNTLTGVAVGGGAAVAVGYAGTILGSPVGFGAWSAETSGTTVNLNAVAYGNGTFVAVGLGGTVLTSVAGAQPTTHASAIGAPWTAQTLRSADDLYSVAYGPAGFVAFGSSVSGTAIFSSPDGVAWTPQRGLTGVGLIRVVYAHGTFVGVGASGAIATSTDGGITWTLQNSGTAATLEGGAFGLGGFVVTGTQGVVEQSAPPAVRLVNLSTRAFVGTGQQELIGGFVISGTASKELLVRGVGPTLSQFGISGELTACQLTVTNSGGATVAFNSGWGGVVGLSAAFAQVGAFALPANSADAALEQPFAPGTYTAQVLGVNEATGVALAEIYDADAGVPASRLVNLSSRAFVGTGSSVLIAGFVVAGNDAETLLIRGVGPGLAGFGLTGILASPVLTLYDGSGNPLAINSGWGGGTVLANAFAEAGAFPLPVNSNDDALLVVLPPGNYTAEITGAGNTTGLALVELYEVPHF